MTGIVEHPARVPVVDGDPAVRVTCPRARA
jgi:hypothetical protein